MRRPFPVEPRLAKKLVPGSNGCLVWTGLVSGKGYGSISVNGKAQKVHRVVWELAFGPIPPGLCVCHRCDNPPCCNVEHLFLGTSAENTADRHAKGRTSRKGAGDKHARGERVRTTKLTDAQVAEIRDLARTRQLHFSEIAARYGISARYVYAIRDGKRAV